jgi:hypothetical protein
MFVPLPLLVLGGLVFLVLLVLAMRPRGRSDDLIAAPRSRIVPRKASSIGPPLELPAETRTEVERLVQAGEVISAIKLVREATGLGLKDAKDIVDEMR